MLSCHRCPLAPRPRLTSQGMPGPCVVDWGSFVFTVTADDVAEQCAAASKPAEDLWVLLRRDAISYRFYTYTSHTFITAYAIDGCEAAGDATEALLSRALPRVRSCPSIITEVSADVPTAKESDPISGPVVSCQLVSENVDASPAGTTVGANRTSTIHTWCMLPSVGSWLNQRGAQCRPAEPSPHGLDARQGKRRGTKRNTQRTRERYKKDVQWKDAKIRCPGRCGHDVWTGGHTEAPPRSKWGTCFECFSQFGIPFTCIAV